VDPHEFETMLAMDERHWWFRGRRRVLSAVLDGLDLPPGAQVLDAGCGSGRTLDELTRYGQVHGMELNPVGAAAARARGHADVREGRIEATPFEDASFDLVTCLDVIEHTPDDVASLRDLRRVTRPGGWLVVTVPAHPRLWSYHDELNLHYRRYTRATLRAAAEAAGWRVERQTGFNVAYLAPAALVRFARRGASGGAENGGNSELALTPAALDTALELPLRLEARLVARGANLPPGLSLLAVMRSP
jgi:SAM-dependent methyltransferase